MPDDNSRPIPTTCPMPDLDLIRLGGKAGQQELANAIANIVNTLNAYIIRKGA